MRNAPVATSTRHDRGVFKTFPVGSRLFERVKLQRLRRTSCCILAGITHFIGCFPMCSIYHRARPARTAEKNRSGAFEHGYARSGTFGLVFVLDKLLQGLVKRFQLVARGGCRNLR
ncbi:unnamed protein product [Ectocarpus sp. 12 AP-2014]